MTTTRSTGRPDHGGGIGAWISVIVLMALLAATAVFAYRGWTLGDGEVPESGYVALTLGVIFSVAFGVGLMALVFYSSRKGYDRPVVRIGDEEPDAEDRQTASHERPKPPWSP